MIALLHGTSRIALFVVTTSLFASCAVDGFRPYDPEAGSAGLELLSVIETGDPERFRRYLRTQTELDDEILFGEDARRFIYDGDWVRQFDEDGKSVIEIIADGSIEIQEAPQPDGTIILIFIPMQYSKESLEPEFYYDQWMRKYFACRFAKIEDRWQLSTNICFAESGGPFPEDYL